MSDGKFIGVFNVASNIKELLPRYLMLLDDGSAAHAEADVTGGYSFTTRRGSAMYELTEFVKWLERGADVDQGECNGSCDSCKCGGS